MLYYTSLYVSSPAPLPCTNAAARNARRYTAPKSAKTVGYVPPSSLDRKSVHDSPFIEAVSFIRKRAKSRGMSPESLLYERSSTWGRACVRRRPRVPWAHHAAGAYSWAKGSAPRAPPPRTKWTRRVPHPVLSGYAASLTPY